MTWTKTVSGIRTSTAGGFKVGVPVTVRVTKDPLGETMSLECGGTMIAVALESLKGLIRIAKER